MAKKKLSVKLHAKSAMTVTRVSLKGKRLVYAIQAQRQLKYPWGRSRVAYIGTTKNGMKRFAASAAYWAEDVLSLHGVREMEVRLITCAPRKNVRSWLKLERAMLLAFREKYGDIPICNTVGKNMRHTDEDAYFTRKRINSILEALE